MKRRRLCGVEMNAMRRANRYGLYVLFEGSGSMRRWRIYDRQTGVVLATYWSESGRCVPHAGNAEPFEEKHHAALMRRLAGKSAPKQ